jgi:hypothetical protein
VARWHARLEPSEEQWIVGGPELDSLRGRAALVTHEDDPNPDARRVTLRRTGAVRATALVLDLPPRQASARLLRDPFTAPAEVARASASFAGARIVFSGDGRRLFVRLRSGPLLAYPVPNSPRAPLAPPASYAPRPGHGVVATDWCGGRWRVVTQAGSMLRVSRLGKNGGDSAPPRSCFSSGKLLDAFDTEAPLAHLIVDPAGPITFQHPTGVLEIVHTLFRRAPAIAILRSGRLRVSLLAGRDGARALHVRDVRSGDLQTQSISGAGDGALRTGFSPRDADPKVGLLAVRMEPGTWLVHTRAKVEAVREEPGFTCVGLTDAGALVGFYAGRPALVVVGKDYVKDVAATSAPIRDACVCAMSPKVAYVTASGEIVVCDLVDGTVLMRLLGAP